MEVGCRNSIDGLPRQSEGKQAKTKFPSSRSFYLGRHQKVPPAFRMGLFYSNTLMEKISHGSPDLVQLTIKISHQREEEFILDYSLKRRYSIIVGRHGDRGLRQLVPLCTYPALRQRKGSGTNQ